MIKLRKGMKVRIKPNIYPGYPCGVLCVKGMEKYAGMVVTIKSVGFAETRCIGDKYKKIIAFKIEEDNGNFWWDTELVDFNINEVNSIFGDDFYKEV